MDGACWARPVKALAPRDRRNRGRLRATPDRPVGQIRRRFRAWPEAEGCRANAGATDLAPRERLLFNQRYRPSRRGKQNRGRAAGRPRTDDDGVVIGLHACARRTAANVCEKSRASVSLSCHPPSSGQHAESSRSRNPARTLSTASRRVTSLAPMAPTRWLPKQRDSRTPRLARDETVSDPRDTAEQPRQRIAFEMVHEEIGDDGVVARMILAFEPGEDIHGGGAHRPAEIRKGRARLRAHEVLPVDQGKRDTGPRARPALCEPQKQRAIAGAQLGNVRRRTQERCAQKRIQIGRLPMIRLMRRRSRRERIARGSSSRR